jgi:uncharacterized RDD family membrane protein YckC
VTSPAGWHPDPVPPQPGQPPQLRYWDGTRWTEHTAPATPPAQPGAGQQPYRTQPAPYAGTYGAAYPTGSPYGANAVPSTPDGVPLAGWGARLGAYLIDGLILGVLGALAAIPWLGQLIDSYSELFDEAMDAGSTGATVDTTAFAEDVAGPLLTITLLALAISLVYNVAFLVWRGATPGKMALGLQVRLRERPGRLGFGTALVRWLAQAGVPGLISLVPVAGSLIWVYSLLDGLWPLWDQNRQSLHDKVAKTNVVRTR